VLFPREIEFIGRDCYQARKKDLPKEKKRFFRLED